MNKKFDRILQNLMDVKQILSLMNSRYTSSDDEKDIQDIGTKHFDTARELLIMEHDKLLIQLQQSFCSNELSKH